MITYTIYIFLLQIVGAFLAIMSSYIRKSPHYILESLWFSIFASILLLLYSTVTGQPGFMVLNSVVLFNSIVAVQNWKKVNVVDKQ